MLQRGGREEEGRKEEDPCLSVVSPTLRQERKGRAGMGKGKEKGDVKGMGGGEARGHNLFRVNNIKKKSIKVSY